MVKINSEYIYDKYIEAIECRFTYSNCYFQKEELNKWLAEGFVNCYCSEDSVVLTVQERGFIKLYYLADSFDWTGDLHGMKKHAGESDLVLEIVTRGNLGEYDLRKYFPFRKVIQYDRLRSKGMKEADMQDQQPLYCLKSDFMRLRNMMDETFHPIGDYIPSDEELTGFLAKQNIICVRGREQIDGFIIFEDKGKTSYIRMVCVSKNARGRGVGEQLMRMYFSIHQNYKGFTLWCRSDNTPAMRLYMKVGQYRNEDFHNYIFVV